VAVDCAPVARSACEWSFNPRPHVADDVLVLGVARHLVVVSIHARTWRATGVSLKAGHPLYVSIHARTWRATPIVQQGILGRRFQSTPARGGRLGQMTIVWVPFKFQSTPARGGRQPTRKFRVPCVLFQSTPARGGRRDICASPLMAGRFQSTPARGGRLQLYKPAAHNSLPPELRERLPDSLQLRRREYLQIAQGLLSLALRLPANMPGI
jgi:hypothetical protein